MIGAVFPLRMFLAVALAIATMAFAIGHVVAGAGMPFVAASTTLWVAYVSRRARRLADHG